MRLSKKKKSLNGSSASSEYFKKPLGLKVIVVEYRAAQGKGGVLGEGNKFTCKEQGARCAGRRLRGAQRMNHPN